MKQCGWGAMQVGGPTDSGLGQSAEPQHSDGVQGQEEESPKGHPLLWTQGRCQKLGPGVRDGKDRGGCRRSKRGGWLCVGVSVLAQSVVLRPPVCPPP